ncbi:bifunctional GNAT family N-acetyltransferase/acetate--CoA ligase family protein [Actinomadura luteofluorescens]|uniref:bifunctional acetate--CoA ligase family protein/GNAT family N-acetyltransferase n=1 Tax=Actinomadura luteofluorescens TaxID=46163 RepID=UPI002164327B|nr:bifunctional GNAT family N-acetyltransferase/acetate--CoA ligase family protein [Actinomadura glauciflava]MCR3741258.1 Acyl-CoA synthetase (NDP forming) [Actinomadura glauciflava]
MTQSLSGARVFALLTDGTQVEIRSLGEADREAVRDLHRGLSEESLYLRFFGLNRAVSEQVAGRVCRTDGEGHAALGAWLHGDLVGVAEYEPTDAPGEAEFAMVVADRVHHRGVGTLLLEHLGSLARAHGIVAFRADTLADNTAMLRVFADAGMAARRRSSGGVVELTLPLVSDDRYLDAVAERERRADVASLEPLMRPRTVAVVGASRRPGTVGAEVLRNLVSAGFGGAVYAVNPHAAGGDLHGAPCVAAPAGLPERPDLVVVAVPAGAVVRAAAECGRYGARGLVVISSGLTAGQGRDLLAVCREHGMRLVGPNCFGTANTAISLDATFGARHPVPGTAGVVAQSGGVGIALLEQLSRLGIGVSSFASVGDKYDVSANDLLMWWESDETTRLGILHVESFGNPRKFARTARRVAARMPLLTVLAGRSAPGTRAAASHTAAAATPEITRRALFEQAGIVATDDLGELVDAAALLASQPLPDGPRVAVVSNAGGAGVLAADACADAGLAVPVLGPDAQRRLTGLLPECAAVANPVDTTAAVSAELFRSALETVAADESVDIVLALVAPTALADLRGALGGCGKPVAAVVLGQPESVVVNEQGVPCYGYPENAVRAFARAFSYARRRGVPPDAPPVLPGLMPVEAAGIVDGFLATRPEGGWLPPVETFRLLESYGLSLAPWCWARTEDETASAAREMGVPVAMKAHVPGVVHKTAAGALRLDLDGDREVREAFRSLAGRFGDALEGVVVQAMVDEGVEVLCGAVQEEVFGAVVIFGAGGVDADALADRTARLAPLTAREADELIREPRLSALLLGHPARPAGDLAALRDVLLRLSRLAAEHPEIAELDLNPTLVRPDGAVAVDARVRLLPRRSWDPYLRRLR